MACMSWCWSTRKFFQQLQDWKSPTFSERKATIETFAPQPKVTCLARRQTNTHPIKNTGCKFVDGDLRNESLVLPRLEQCGALFNVAAMKNAANHGDMVTINPRVTRNLLEAVLRSSHIPQVIHVSSLAVSGPSKIRRPTIETDRAVPVSYYGRSKLESERTISNCGDRFPVSIVKPPIVMGQGDDNGLKMFKLTEQLN